MLFGSELSREQNYENFTPVTKVTFNLELSSQNIWLFFTNFLLSVGLTGKSVCPNESFASLEESHSIKFPSKPRYTQNYNRWMKPDFRIVRIHSFYSIHFTFPIMFCSLHCFFHHPLYDVYKPNIFITFRQGISHQIQRSILKLIWTPRIKEININNLV